MSTTMAILHLILIISLHACSARRFGFLDKEETVKASLLQLPHKKLVEPMLKENLRDEAEARGIQIRNHNKGNEAIPSLNEELLQKTAELQGQKRQARLMIESPSPRNAEETMLSNEKDMGEDIVVMDYAQPHRKPPIHNKEP